MSQELRRGTAAFGAAMSAPLLQSTSRRWGDSAPAKRIGRFVPAHASVLQLATRLADPNNNVERWRWRWGPDESSLRLDGAVMYVGCDMKCEGPLTAGGLHMETPLRPSGIMEKVRQLIVEATGEIRDIELGKSS